MPRSGFEAKLARLKALKTALEREPLTFQKACELLKGVNPRMVQYYLRELCELDIAVYDAEAKAYKLKRLQKIVFESKADYEIALKHSRKLLLSDKEKQRFDLINPHTAILMLAFPEGVRFDSGVSGFGEIVISGWEEPELLQHLKTGYFEDFWLPLQKYRKMIKESDFPDLSETKPPRSPVPPFIPKFGTPEYEEWRKHLKAEEERERERRRKFLSSPEIKQLKDLEMYLIGKLYTLMRSVEHGIPLAGYCDLCPHLRITIKET